MAIERAPYIRYSEQSSVVNYDTATGSDIPVLIAPCKIYKTDNSGVVQTTLSEPSLSKDEIFAFTSYERAKKRIDNTSGSTGEKVLKFLKQFFEENSYYGLASGMGVPYVYFVPLPTTDTTENNTTTSHPTVGDVTKAMDLVSNIKEITALFLLGVTDYSASGVLSDVNEKISLLEEDNQYSPTLRIAYSEAPSLNNNETIKQYATRVAGYCYGTTGSDGIGAVRLGLIYPEESGRLFAHICNTPYYVEPGYLPLQSISVGKFTYFTREERDALCMAGVIFGEDDDLLPTTVPRICLGTSTAFSRVPSDTYENYGTRLVDSLLHARRNVDHHVREVLKILAYQLKNNETSVSLRYVKNQILQYFENELKKGTIQAYSFNVEEASYNPYCLLVTGEIVPVNCTLGIDFQNYIYAPYSVSSQYI